MDGLADSEPPAPTGPAKAADQAEQEVESPPKAAAPGPAQPPRGPPPRPPVRATADQACGQWRGRTAFDDLFALETQAGGAVRGGLEGKVEYLREKLKQAEGQISRFRQAWQVRDQDMDALEALWEQSRRQSDENEGKAQQLQAFIETKKLEFEAYGQKVAQAFQEREGADEKLKAEHAEALATLQAAKEEMAAELRREMEEQEEELHQKNIELESSLRQEMHEEVKKARSERDEVAERLQQECQDLEETLRSELQQALSDASAKAGELADTQGSIDHQLQLRDEAIVKLKRMVSRQRETLADKDQQIEEAAARSGQAAAQGSEDAASQQEALRARDQAIAKLKQGLKQAQQALEAHQDGTPAHASETDAEVETLKAKLAQSSGAAQKKIRSLVERLAQQTAEIERLRTAVDGSDETSVTRVRMAFEVAQKLLDDLRANTPRAFDESNRIGEALVRVHKAVTLGANASKSI